MTIVSGNPLPSWCNATSPDPLGGVSPPIYERTITHRRMTISIGSRRPLFAIERIQERYSVRSAARHPQPDDVPGLPGRMLFGLTLICLLLAGVALLPAPAPATRYSAILAIPGKPVAAQPRPPAPQLAHFRSAAARRTAPDPARITEPSDLAQPRISPLTSSAIDAPLGQPDASPDIEELPAAAGERALAVLGALRKVNGKSCRDVQLFSRSAGGTVSVRATVRCGP